MTPMPLSLDGSSFSAGVDRPAAPAREGPAPDAFDRALHEADEPGSPGEDATAAAPASAPDATTSPPAQPPAAAATPSPPAEGEARTPGDVRAAHANAAGASPAAEATDRFAAVGDPRANPRAPLLPGDSAPMPATAAPSGLEPSGLAPARPGASPVPGAPVAPTARQPDGDAIGGGSDPRNPDLSPAPAAAAGEVSPFAPGVAARPADGAAAAPAPALRDPPAPEPARAAAASLPLQDGAADGAVLRNAAHLRVTAPGVGDLELHLRVRDGVAHLRVDGDGARAIESRAAELSRALAGEGLRLGAFDAKPAAAAAGFGGAGSSSARDHGSSGRQRDDAPAPPAPPTPPPHRIPRATSPAMTGRYAVRA